MPEWAWSALGGALFLAFLFWAAWRQSRKEEKRQEQSFGNRVAPRGFVYRCSACGKRSRDRYGDQAIDPLWDESCMMHAELVKEEEDGDDEGDDAA